MRTLDVIVVGAGIGGLSTALALAGDGHRVTVLDAIKEFAEVGAGIRIPPNAYKLATHWGVDFTRIRKEVSRGNRFVRWSDGKVLCEVAFGGKENGESMEKKYGAPYHFVHRADLVDGLRRAARELYSSTITIHTSTRVISYDFHKPKPSVRTATGEEYTGDLIISADGIKSLGRDAINGGHVVPVDTGDVAYRILVPGSVLLEDPDPGIRGLVTGRWAMHWMGPEAHVVGYPLRGGELYNIIIDITHRTDLGSPLGDADWKASTDINTGLIQRFEGWCPAVQRICWMPGECVKWKLVELERPLGRWVDESGSVAVLGDAAHPMMPYLAQGAAQVMEDAAALRYALSYYLSEPSGDSSPSCIPSALHLYQSLRAPRASYITSNTQILQEWLHLHDGPAQEARDALMALGDSEDNPIFWASAVRRDWLFGWEVGDPAKAIHAREEKEEEEEEEKMGMGIPRFPPLPPREASVYPGKDLRAKLFG
ncbi:salicylate hydroxylase [Lentinula edodes]|nr:salicylate hydroxylase [Lentinula edodes]